MDYTRIIETKTQSIVLAWGGEDMELTPRTFYRLLFYGYLMSLCNNKSKAQLGVIKYVNFTNILLDRLNDN